MPETAKRTARVPILGEDGRISDDYIPAAIGEGVESAEAAATRAETAATDAEGSTSAARQSATQAASSASAASSSATQAQQSATTAGGAVTQAQSAQTAAEAAKTAAETAQAAAAGSAQDAHQSATAAASSAASVADKFIASAQATTLEPGSEATASVADQVLTLGIPRGDKGDKGDTGEKGDPGDVSAVQAAEGSDLSVSTDGGTVTIDDSALRARIAELENQAANVVTGTSTDLVSHAEDAYPQKPIEVRVKGKTWVNRWPVLSGTHNGITVATDETGLVTVTGTATADADVTADVSGWAAGKSYTTMISATPTGCSAYFEVQKPSGNTSINATTTGATLNVASDATNCVAGVHVTSGTTVNASFRVMLVDGSEAPDCFTPPASITSAQPENLVTSGKNLINPTTNSRIVNGVTIQRIDGLTFSAQGTATNGGGRLNEIGRVYLQPGQYTLSKNGGTSNVIAYLSLLDDPSVNYGTYDIQVYDVAIGGLYILGMNFTNSAVIDETFTVQLELGSTATSYEPPTVTQTPLPEVELRSLPNGTCDELVIKSDGTCEVERNVTEYEVQGTEALKVGEHSNGQKYATIVNVASYSSSSSSLMSDRYSCDAYNTIDKYAYVPNARDLVINDSRFADVDTAKSILASEKPKFVFEVTQTEEPQSPVTLPALPAPTFNQYHDSPVPSDTSTEYARDINIVLSNLESVQAALLGGE